MQHRIEVLNIQQYAIGRGGFRFAPGEPRVVTTITRQQYAEIKACVYLCVKELHATPPSVPELPLHATKALADLTKAELLALAGTLDVKVAKRATKPTIITAIEAAGAELVVAEPESELVDDEPADDDETDEDEDEE